MKTLILTTLILIAGIIAQAQCDKANYEKLIREGDQLAKNEKYINAVRKYMAATIICPDNNEKTQQKIVDLFNKIEELKIKAEKNEKSAIVALEEAEAQKRYAEQQKQIADQQKQNIVALLRYEIENTGIKINNLYDYYYQKAEIEYAKGIYINAINNYNRAKLMADDEKLKSKINNSLFKIDTILAILKEAGILNANQNFATAIEKYMKIMQINTTDSLTLLRIEFAGMLNSGYMVSIDGGTFTRFENKANTYSQKQKENIVTVDKFYISKYELTQYLFQKIIGRNNSYFNDNPQKPVEQVDWYESIEFCNLLSELMGLTPFYIINKTEKDEKNTNIWDTKKYKVEIQNYSNGFRLPTEAEWEFAASGGNTGHSKWAGTDNKSCLDDYAWYKRNSKRATHQVGQKKTNTLGLYDMSGNVIEWCWDWHGSYSAREVINPQGTTSGGHRVLRGGSYLHRSDYCRTEYRWYDFANTQFSGIGFRLVWAP